MVAAVRKGLSLRAAAREFGVSLSVVQRWVERAGETRLTRVNWRGEPRGLRPSPKRTPAAIEAEVLRLREELRQKSALGEYGAVAIWERLRALDVKPVPTERTINRILARWGCFDSRHRVRRPAPPRGWYLPEVAAGRAELDQFDTITDLVIEGGQEVTVLTGISLHGGLIGCWPTEALRSASVRQFLETHWRSWGRPDYAQFDNDTLFQGPHQHPDVIGTVTRLCLSLGITPVFAPPRETGFQAAVESLNCRWQAKVWERWHHESLEMLQGHSERYVAAARAKSFQRQESAPLRQSIAPDLQVDLTARPRGRVLFLRRSDDQGRVSLLGHVFPVDRHWLHRLVRAEVSLPEDGIRFYALRRRDPANQPLLNKATYRLPSKRYLR